MTLALSITAITFATAFAFAFVLWVYECREHDRTRVRAFRELDCYQAVIDQAVIDQAVIDLLVQQAAEPAAPLTLIEGGDAA